MPEAKSTQNTSKEWTPDDVQQLRELAGANTPVGVIGLKLGRSEDSVRSKASAEGISMSPPNRSPYGDMS